MNIDYVPFLGVPYQTNGRTMRGADCVGLAMLLYRHHGIELRDPVELIKSPVGGRPYAELPIEDEWLPGWTQVGHYHKAPVGSLLMFGTELLINHVAVLVHPDWYLDTNPANGSLLRPRSGAIIAGALVPPAP